jgi:hypothetical protein
MSSKGGLSATPVKLKKIKAAFWTHRCAMDFDCKFVCIAQEQETEDDAEEVQQSAD